VSFLQLLALLDGMLAAGAVAAHDPWYAWCGWFAAALICALMAEADRLYTLRLREAEKLRRKLEKFAETPLRELHKKVVDRQGRPI
jgi:hypothetical protein